jgi:hypothetical protein
VGDKNLLFVCFFKSGLAFKISYTLFLLSSFICHIFSFSFFLHCFSKHLLIISTTTVPEHRLGSPDAAEELAQLDRIEQERSLEFTLNVLKFRNVITRRLWEHSRNFLDDLAACSRGFLVLLDSIMRREVLQVPPDTAIPKKRMTVRE